MQTRKSMKTCMEKSYPYLAKDGTCHYNASWSGGKDSGFIDIGKGSEIQLNETVNIIAIIRSTLFRE